MEDDQKFLTYCRMTCPDGSEGGKCPCHGPWQCKMKTHPLYGKYREGAVGRAFLYLKNKIEEPEEAP